MKTYVTAILVSLALIFGATLNAQQAKAQNATLTAHARGRHSCDRGFQRRGFSHASGTDQACWRSGHKRLES